MKNINNLIKSDRKNRPVGISDMIGYYFAHRGATESRHWKSIERTNPCLRQIQGKPDFSLDVIWEFENVFFA